jgi:hypothetical protein
MKLIYNFIVFSVFVLHITVLGYADSSSVPIEFKDAKGSIIKTLNVPSKCMIAYDLDIDQKVFSVGYTPDPNMVSLPGMYANAYYVFTYLNPKPRLIQKQENTFFRTTCLNGPFYLICDASSKKLNVMLADSKCIEIEIKDLVLPVKTEGLFFLRQNAGSQADIQYSALNLSPLLFERPSKDNTQLYSIFPETIIKDSLMDQYYSSKTKNIVISNTDYELLAKILFEKKSFLVIR